MNKRLTSCNYIEVTHLAVFQISWKPIQSVKHNIQCIYICCVGQTELVSSLVSETQRNEPP